MEVAHLESTDYPHSSPNGKMPCEFNRAISNMDTNELGVKLARLIEETVAQSIDDICGTFGKQVEHDRGIWQIFFEYIALLLWIASKEAPTVLPKKAIQDTIDAMVSATFYTLRDESNETFKDTFKDFNEKTFLNFTSNRFKMYYRAWRAYPTMLSGEIEDAKTLIELSEITVVHNFVICCLIEEEDMLKAQAEYREYYPGSKYYATHILGVLQHYRRFSERVKSVLSHF